MNILESFARHGLRPGARKPATRPTPGSPRATSPSRSSSTASGPPPRQDLRHQRPGDRQAAGQDLRRRRGRCRRGGRRRRARRCRNGARSPAMSAPRSSTPSAAPCSATSGCSPCSKRSTTASRSAKAATSTCRWSTRHFYPPRRLGAGAGPRVPRPQCRTASCGQIIPWNFPLLMLAWKIAPALAAGNTVVLKPAEFTSLTAHPVRRDLRTRRPAEGRRQHRHRRGRETGAAIVNHPDVDKIAFTGSTEVGKIIRARHRRLRQGAVARARRQVAPSSSSRTPISTAPSRGWSMPSGSTRARSAAPARACWCRRASPSASSPSSRRAWRTLRVGDPLDKTIDIGALVDAGAGRPRPRPGRRGRAEGRRSAGSPTARCPPPAASICRRWSPASRPPTCWRRRRSSGRCWWR